MKLKQYYISNVDPMDVVHDTDLSIGEIEEIVGRFHDQHRFSGALRGQVWVYDNKVQIRHHFLKSRILWEAKYV